MSTSRTATVGGVYSWRFDRTARVWCVVGDPHIRLTPTTMRAGRGHVRLAWRLSPGGEIYPDYHEGMLAAEGITPIHWRDIAADRRRSRRKTR